MTTQTTALAWLRIVLPAGQKTCALSERRNALIHEAMYGQSRRVGRVYCPRGFWLHDSTSGANDNSQSKFDHAVFMEEAALFASIGSIKISNMEKSARISGKLLRNIRHFCQPLHVRQLNTAACLSTND